MAVLETKSGERSAAAGAAPPKPDAGALHCAECHSPLAADQAACLECGAVVNEPTRYKRWLSARWPLRTGLATAAIFVLSASVALAASVATQTGGNPPSQAFAGTQTPGQVPIVPPSTVGVGSASDSSTSGNPPSAPTSTQSGGPSSTPAPKAPTTPAPTSANPTESSAPSTAGPSSTPTTTSPSNSGPSEPFGGTQPANGGGFGPGTQSGHPASNAIDGDPSTYWLTNEAGSGVWLSTVDSTYSRIGIQPASGHTGFVVQVYGSNHKPTSANNATEGVAVGSTHTINGATKLKLGGTDFKYYSIYVMQNSSRSADAGIAELSLIP